MKKHDDYLSTSIWYREVIEDPYQVIAECFDYATIDSYRKTVKGVLISISKDKCYRKDNPADLIYEFKMIESAINAAYIINQEEKKSPLDISPAHVFDKNLYCSRHSDLSEWDDFPRALSLKEYVDPYVVFKKFFEYRKLKGWKKDMERILEFALSDESIFESGVTFDILSIHIHLTKLVEAAHLIDVRENTRVGGQIKNRS